MTYAPWAAPVPWEQQPAHAEMVAALAAQGFASYDEAVPCARASASDADRAHWLVRQASSPDAARMRAKRAAERTL